MISKRYKPDCKGLPRETSALGNLSRNCGLLFEKFYNPEKEKESSKSSAEPTEGCSDAPETSHLRDSWLLNFQELCELLVKLTWNTPTVDVFTLQIIGKYYPSAPCSHPQPVVKHFTSVKMETASRFLGWEIEKWVNRRWREGRGSGSRGWGSPGVSRPGRDTEAVEEVGLWGRDVGGITARTQRKELRDSLTYHDWADKQHLQISSTEGN